MAKYIIDTCSLTAMRRVYPRDVFPSAWDKLDELAESKTIASTEDVLEEIKSQDDEILEWANEYEEIFHPLSEEIQLSAIKILETHENLIDLKKKKSGADPFVIATAMVHSCAVVTEEKPSGGPSKSKIPDVCLDYGVKCMKILDMLRIEGLRA
ncbi:MAG: DUF4411 family protein [Bacteroidales bacterium]|jgi:hypothetical protein|nr:DUF4411 family protein [Bacteroidales bacterium]